MSAQEYQQGWHSINHAWLIWSNEHRAWWKARASGYTKYASDAGRYSLEEAVEICKTAHVGTRPDTMPPETMIREDCIYQ